MPYHFLTLTLILVLATGTFLFSHQAFNSLLATDQLKKWRNSWYAVTLIAFFSSNFWLYIVICGLYLKYITKREENILALYFFLLLAIPPIEKSIPGLGIIKLFPINYATLLSLVLLLPTFLSLRSRSDKVSFGSTWPDKLIIAILSLTFLLLLRGTTFTDAIRYGITEFLVVFLPYYAASRGIKDMSQLKSVMIGFVMGCLVAAAIGIFEFSSSWLLYNSLDEFWGIQWSMGGYLGRSDSVRAVSSTGHSIILGYVMMIALGFYFFVSGTIKSKVIRLLGFGFIFTGLFVTLSRGPWVGSIALIIIFIATGSNAFKKLIIFLLIASLTVPLLQVIPGGNKIIDIIPFIGTSEQFNVNYRERLLNDSMKVIIKNPLFGVFDAAKEPEMQDLIQGDQIIDIVNTYLAISLNQGLIGLSLFFGFFLLILSTTYKSMRKFSKTSQEHLCGRSLLACLVGILVTIYTVSTIGIIPILLWSLAGLMLSYCRIVKSIATDDIKLTTNNLTPTNKQIYPTSLVRK